MSKYWEFGSYAEDGDEHTNSYVERFDHYSKATQIEDSDFKKSAFITALMKRPYKSFKDLLVPAAPEEKPLDDIVNELKKHFGPGSQVIADGFKLNRRHQLEIESVSAFAVELRHMASNCAFMTF